MNYQNLFSCKDKVAIVTGGAGLIGRDIVRCLLDFGARVYIADIDKKAAGNLIPYRRSEYIHLDIGSQDSVKKMISRVKDKDGRIDILVNCAYPKTKDWARKLERIIFSSWKKNIDMHLGGYFLACRAAAEVMKKQKSGSIVNLASIYGVTAPDFRIYGGTDMTMPAAYSAIKGAIISFTKYLAIYYAQYNVRVNAVSPGGIFNNQDKRFVKKYSAKTPLGRMGVPADVAGAVVYLASDASSYVTGCNLLVDGGWTAW